MLIQIHLSVYGIQGMKHEPLSFTSLVHGQINTGLLGLSVLALVFLIVIFDLKALLQNEDLLSAFVLVARRASNIYKVAY